MRFSHDITVRAEHVDELGHVMLLGYNGFSL